MFKIQLLQNCKLCVNSTILENRIMLVKSDFWTIIWYIPRLLLVGVELTPVTCAIITLKCTDPTCEFNTIQK